MTKIKVQKVVYTAEDRWTAQISISSTFSISAHFDSSILKLCESFPSSLSRLILLLKTDLFRRPDGPNPAIGEHPLSGTQSPPDGQIDNYNIILDFYFFG